VIVLYDNDVFVSEFVRLLICKPLVLDETTISITLVSLGSHKFIANISKLVRTPTVTSKQPVRGIITGASEQFDSDVT